MPLGRAHGGSPRSGADSSHVGGTGGHKSPSLCTGPNTECPGAVGPRRLLQLRACHRHAGAARDNVEMRRGGCAPIALSLQKRAAPARSGRRRERPCPTAASGPAELRAAPGRAVSAVHPHAPHTQLLAHENCFLILYNKYLKKIFTKTGNLTSFLHRVPNY